MFTVWATFTDLLYLPDHTDPTRANSSESDDLRSVVGDGVGARPSQTPVAATKMLWDSPTGGTEPAPRESRMPRPFHRPQSGTGAPGSGPPGEVPRTDPGWILASLCEREITTRTDGSAGRTRSLRKEMHESMVIFRALDLLTAGQSIVFDLDRACGVKFPPFFRHGTPTHWTIDGETNGPRRRCRFNTRMGM